MEDDENIAYVINHDLNGTIGRSGDEDPEFRRAVQIIIFQIQEHASILKGGRYMNLFLTILMNVMCYCIDGLEGNFYEKKKFLDEILDDLKKYTLDHLIDEKEH